MKDPPPIWNQSVHFQFLRGQSVNVVCITSYYGDGDSKAFQTVENVYEGQKVQKYECIGHYQKRVANRLRKLKQRLKGLGGKAKAKKEENIPKQDGGKITKVKKIPAMRLTDTLINKLQNYFGIALGSKVAAVPEFQNALLASSFRTASSKESDYHTYCPPNS